MKWTRRRTSEIFMLLAAKRNRRFSASFGLPFFPFPFLVNLIWPSPEHHAVNLRSVQFGMDLKNLSSNWKKLQETLKKDPVSTSTKRKTSDRDVQHGVVKKRKSEVVDGKKKFETTRYSKKRKRMADGSDGGENGVQETAGKSASRRNSTAAESQIAKVNEGRSPT